MSVRRYGLSANGKIQMMEDWMSDAMFVRVEDYAALKRRRDEMETVLREIAESLSPWLSTDQKARVEYLLAAEIKEVE